MQTILFLAQGKTESDLMRALTKYCDIYHEKTYKPIYKRIIGFFHIEAIFALQKVLPQEIQDEISEMAFKRFLKKQKPNYKPKPYVKFFFNWLAKIYFLKYYLLFKKLELSKLIILDNNTILKKACIFAANSLNIKVKILYESYKRDHFFIDYADTRFKNSMPRNAEFYKNTTPISQKAIENNNTQDVIIVLLQDDFSQDILLHSPWVQSQLEFLEMIMRISLIFPQTQFLIFNANKQYNDTQNVIFLEKDFKEFLPIAKAVLTCNSIEAIYALKNHKPIINVGNAIYNINGIAFSANSEKKLVNILKNFNVLKFNKKTTDGFTYFLERNLIKCDVINTKEEDLRNIIDAI